MNKTYIFQASKNDEPFRIDCDENAVEDTSSPCSDSLHLYFIEGNFTWKDLSALANKLMLLERPNISVIDAADAQRSGDLREPNQNDKDYFGLEGPDAH